MKPKVTVYEDSIKFESRIIHGLTVWALFNSDGHVKAAYEELLRREQSPFYLVDDLDKLDRVSLHAWKNSKGKGVSFDVYVFDKHENGRRWTGKPYARKKDRRAFEKTDKQHLAYRVRVYMKEPYKEPKRDLDHVLYS